MSLVVGVLLASLVGSIHCAAMCGGFVCLYAGSPVQRGASNGPVTRSMFANWTAHLAYNGGRLVSYLALGAAAGAIGARIDDLGRLAGLGRGAAVVAGTLMVVWASSVIAASAGVHVPASGAPQWAKRLLGGALIAIRNRPPVTRAAVTGLLTTLLPCGWLYTFVVTAGGTGSALAGAVVMLAFWAGTVPILVSVGVGAHAVLGSFARRLPVVSAALVLVLGLLSISGKMRPPAMHVAAASTAHAPQDAPHDAR